MPSRIDVRRVSFVLVEQDKSCINHSSQEGRGCDKTFKKETDERR